MIGRRELDSLEARIRTAPRVGPGSLGQRRLERAAAAGASGTWTWDDARLVFSERAEEWRDHARKTAWLTRRELEETQYKRVTADAPPVICAILIATYRPGEEVPPQFGEQLLKVATSPKGWTVTLPNCTPNGWDEVASAVMLMVALETPDALRLRREIWAPQRLRRRASPTPSPAVG